MRSGNFSIVKGYGKGSHNYGNNGHESTTGLQVGESLKVAWAVVVLLVSGLFALITAILIAWPALAYIAAKFFG